ncbi:hypothetical protein Scep_001380 [Stephania cephalantha]|uniref:Uncharacterized protein n=1 Tax=Stephania cephalantha TaxID=152367 RepID=A0AAP0LBN1_9MAGN
MSHKYTTHFEGFPWNWYIFGLHYRISIYMLQNGDSASDRSPLIDWCCRCQRSFEETSTEYFYEEDRATKKVKNKELATIKQEVSQTFKSTLMGEGADMSKNPSSEGAIDEYEREYVIGPEETQRSIRGGNI